jgi:hypothetical protein
MATKRVCRECGKEFQPKRASGFFCGTVCRKTWNNRRALRGQELYDLFMEMRFNRCDAKDQGYWTILCSLASAYKTADETLRSGRQSWDRAAVMRIPQGFGAQGDKR